MTVILTPEAINKVNFLLQEGVMTSADIRLVSACAGCGGLRLVLSINEPRQENDKIICVNNISIIIEEHSEKYIGNTIIDYVHNEYGGNFIVSNEYGSSVCFY